MNLVFDEDEIVDKLLSVDGLVILCFIYLACHRVVKLGRVDFVVEILRQLNDHPLKPLLFCRPQHLPIFFVENLELLELNLEHSNVGLFSIAH